MKPGDTVGLLIGLAASLTGVSAWLVVIGLVRPYMVAVLASGSAGLLVALVGRPGPTTVSVLADLLLLIPAVVEIVA